MALLAFPGCFPVELDVSSDGKILIPREEGFFSLNPSTQKIELLYKPDAGRPVFGRFSPDGQSILAVTEGGGAAMMGKSYDFSLVTLSDKRARKIYTGANTTYALFSPDGKHISVSQVAGAARPPLEESLPEIYVINVEDASNRLLVSNVGSIHRWLPNSKSLLVFEITAKDKQQSNYSGSLSIVDIASGKKKAAASAFGSKDFFLDISPDGKKAFFTAMAVGKPGANSDGNKTKLYELTFKPSGIREIGEDIKYAVYSPAGDQVLLGSASKENKLKLEVCDPLLSKRLLIADKVPGTVGSNFGSQTSVYPGWVGNASIFYISERAVYGTEGMNLDLMVADAKGGPKHAYQAEIESAVMKGSESGWAPPVVVPAPKGYDLRFLSIYASGALILGLILGRLFFRR